MRGSKRDTDVLSSLLDSVGEGEGGMIWENGIERCKLSYVKNCQSRFDAWYRMLSAGALGCNWDPNPEGWDGEGHGRVVQGGEHMYTHEGFISMYGKTNTMF